MYEKTEESRMLFRILLKKTILLQVGLFMRALADACGRQDSAGFSRQDSADGDCAVQSSVTTSLFKISV